MTRANISNRFEKDKLSTMAFAACLSNKKELMVLKEKGKKEIIWRAESIMLINKTGKGRLWISQLSMRIKTLAGRY